MKKQYTKKNLKFQDGYILNKDGEIVTPEGLPKDVNLFASLIRETKNAVVEEGVIKDDKLQKQIIKAEVKDEYGSLSQVAEVIEASDDPYAPETPEIDRKNEEGRAVRREIDMLNAYHKAKSAFSTLLTFIKDEAIYVDDENVTDIKLEFDPLNMTQDSFWNVVYLAAEKEVTVTNAPIPKDNDGDIPVLFV